MSRDKNKPPRRNPFLDDSRDTLLDELGSVKKLLDEDDKTDSPAARPGPHDDIPVLLPDEASTSEGEGDAHTQASLFDQPAASKGNNEAETEEARRRRLLAASRDNPFLPSKSMQDLANERDRLTRITHGSSDATTRTTTAGKSAPPAGEKNRSLDDAAVRALVDEMLAEWLPKIERELRDRLTRHLKDE